MAGPALRRPSDHGDDEASPPPVAPTPFSIQEVALVALTVIVVVFALRAARELLVPVVLGVLLSYGLEPPVAILARWRLPRPLGAALVLGAFLAAVGLGAWALQDEVVAFATNLPVTMQKVREAVRPKGMHGGPLEKVQTLATQIEKNANDAAAAPTPPKGVVPVQIQPKAIDLRGYLWSGSLGLAALASQAALLFFLAYFVLASGDLYKRKLVKLIGPSLARKKITVQVMDDINVQIQRFILVRALASVLVGTASAIAFSAFGLEQAIVWGIAAGVLNSITYFGPGIVTAAVTVAAFLQLGSITSAAGVACVSLVLTTIDGFLLVPWLISRAARMNEVAVFVGLLFWGWVWGVIGLLLAVPLMMVAKAVCDRVEDLQPLGELLGE